MHLKEAARNTSESKSLRVLTSGCGIRMTSKTSKKPSNEKRSKLPVTFSSDEFAVDDELVVARMRSAVTFVSIEVSS